MPGNYIDVSHYGPVCGSSRRYAWTDYRVAVSDADAAELERRRRRGQTPYTMPTVRALIEGTEKRIGLQPQWHIGARFACDRAADE